MLLPRFRYRTTRRLLLLLILCILVFAVSYLQDVLYDALHSQKPSPGSDKTITVTHTMILTQTCANERPTHVQELPTSTPRVEWRKTPRILPLHEYRQDGLVEVNPDGVHPIYELIERSEAEWNAKLKHASKSLDEAVAEYHRRYNRPPPLGFESW